MTGELTKAHNKFIQDVGTIEQKEENAFHNSKYASLEGVLSIVNPALARNGLSIFQTFDFTDNGQHVLHTTLSHVSGEKIESAALFPQTNNKNPLHGFGANCTYIRRYTLLAILGICAGIEDDDGNNQSPSTTKSEPAITTHQSSAKTIALSPPAPKDERNNCLNQIKYLKDSNVKAFNLLKQDYFKHFQVPSEMTFSNHIQEKIHLEFLSNWFVKNPSLIKP